LIISHMFHMSQKTLLDKHKFDQMKDARVTIFSKCLVAIDSTLLGILLRLSSLNEEAWWNGIWLAELGLSEVPDEQSIKMIRKNFMEFLVVGFFHSFFSAMESAFRIYLREIDLIACNNGTADFEAIYNCLFKELKLQQRQQYKELLNLLRQIRNTVHNNGAYFNRDGKDTSVTYKGISYKFEISKPVKFPNGALAFLLDLMPDTLKMIEDVVYSAEIISKSKIIDPFVT
jgi:hypothetical protein